MNPEQELGDIARERLASYLNVHRINLQETVRRLKYAQKTNAGKWAAGQLAYYSHALAYVKHMQSVLRGKKTRKLLSDFEA